MDKNIKNNYLEILNFLEKPKAYFFLIAVEKTDLFNVGDKLLLDEDGNLVYSTNKKNFDINVKDFPYAKIGIIEVEIDDKSFKFYLEKFSPNERIIIFGAGHIGKLLADMLQFFNFKVIAVDDRKDLLDAVDDKYAEKLWIEFNEINDKLKISDRDYLIIVTRGHLYDKDVLEQVINSPAKYIGMIGSKKRVKAVKNLLIEEGYSKEKLNELYSPIGLPISSNAVEEIALSIIAEIIAVKNGKKIYENIKRTY